MKIQIPYSKNLQKSFALFVSPTNGKKYVTPAWIEVPIDTTLDDVEIVFDNIQINQPVESSRTAYEVEGSKGAIYEVIIDSQQGNSCSCVGFGFHRNCKHIKQILAQSN